MRQLLYTILVVTLTACTVTESSNPKDTTEDLILRVQGANRLYTTEYVVHKIITYDDIVRLQGEVLSHKFDIKIPQPSRKVLIPMEAHLKAYIDFSGFSRENVVFGTDSTVWISLPDPQVTLTSTKIDNSGIREYVDYGRSKFTNAELAEFESQGRAAIIRSVPELGIIETSRLQAYDLMVPLLEKMGYKRDKITIDFNPQYNQDSYLNQLIKSQIVQ